MAVNIANALLPKVNGSYLCCTRQEGLLKKSLKPEVGYLYLQKKRSLDLQAVFRLRKFIMENEISIVHAHSTSFFLAGLLKLTGSRFKLIWHDHYGESESLEKREFQILKKFSRLFAGIISVNTTLKTWALEKLESNNVIEIKNFISKVDSSEKAEISLKGAATDFKIICVANLRPQKDHFNLIKAFELLNPEQAVSLHLVGEDPKTSYSATVLEAIKNSYVKEKIFYYGTQKEIIPLLQQADLGVLSSNSEGLPLALLEYGTAGLPVVCTDVGNCDEVIGNNGRLVQKENSSQLSNEIMYYIKNRGEMKREAEKFKMYVIKNFSENEVIKRLLKFYKDAN